MSKITQLIIESRYLDADEKLGKKIDEIVSERLMERKKLLVSEMDKRTLEKRAATFATKLKSAQDKFKSTIKTSAEKLRLADKNSKKGMKNESEDRKSITENTPFPFNTGENRISDAERRSPKKKEEKQGDLHYSLWKNEFQHHLNLHKIDIPWNESRLRELYKINMDPEEAFRMYTNIREEEELPIDIDEDFNLTEKSRIRIVKARVRGGKVQRRKKVSNVKGYTMRKLGKAPPRLVKMSPIERRKRKVGARRAKIKRRSKLSRMRQKRRISMRKRKAIGLR